MPWRYASSGSMGCTPAGELAGNPATGFAGWYETYRLSQRGCTGLAGCLQQRTAQAWLYRRQEHLSGNPPPPAQPAGWCEVRSRTCPYESTVDRRWGAARCAEYTQSQSGYADGDRDLSRHDQQWFRSEP